MREKQSVSVLVILVGGDWPRCGRSELLFGAI